jgi:hypothetical protein
VCIQLDCSRPWAHGTELLPSDEAREAQLLPVPPQARGIWATGELPSTSVSELAALSSQVTNRLLTATQEIKGTHTHTHIHTFCERKDFFRSHKLVKGIFFTGELDKRKKFF